MTNKNSDYYFLRGGGEMGELIRAKDWSTTSLGDPADWPQSLRTMVAVMLDNPFGMYIAWGSEYIQLYNDGYRPILGATKHPQALGISTRETFSEIWHIIESMFDGVMNGKAVGYPDLMLPLNRNGFVEECYFDFSYSPIRKDNGEVGGVLVTVIETTDKKKAENQLKESEQRFRTLAEASDILIAVGDETSNAIYFNKAWVNLTGRSMDDLLKFGWVDLVHPDDRERYVNIYLKAFETKVAFTGEFRVLSKNGEYRWLLAQGPPLFRPDGSFAGYISSCMDITDQKNAIRKTEESELLFKLALAGSNQIVFSQDQNLIHTWIYNPHPDFTQNHIIGKSDKDLHIPESAAVLTRIKQKVLDSGNAFNGDIEIEVNGKKCNYTLHIEAIKDCGGNITGITGTSTDITERIKIEQRIKESEEQFSTLADNMENLAWLANGEGWIYWYNKRWLEYTGLTLEEMQGWGWQKVHHPDHVERVVELSKKIWNTNEPFELTFPLRRHDGAYRWFLTRGHPITNEEGKIIRWIGTNTDIDEQKKAEDQFRVLADQAPMWVWQTDKEINVLYANPEVLRFIGIAHYTEFTGHMWEQKVHPEDIALVYKSFGEAVSLQQSFSFEFRVQNAITLQYEWFYIKGVPRWEGGEFAGFIGTGININEQKLILSQLQYGKALLEAHNESSLDGILLVNTKGKMLSSNRRFAEIWNMPQQIVDDKDDEAALAFALTQLINPEQFIERVRWMYKNPQEISIDELEFKDGKIIERYGYHVTGTDGSYYGCSWMFRDITEQRKYERAVKESEGKFRLLADSMPQHIWTSDTEGNLNYYNKSVFDYSGLNLEQINKDGWIQIVHPDDKEQNIKQWLNAVATGKDFIMEHRFRRHDGEYRWQLSRAVPQRDETGKIQMWVGTSTDIQEQKTFANELEEQVKIRTAELTVSEEKFYKLFNLSPICKTLSDLQSGQIVMINDAFTKLFGYSREETLGKSSAELGLLDLEARQIMINELKTTGKIENKEIWFIKKSGERFIALASSEIINIGDKRFFFSAFHDISEIKNAERHIKQKNIELENKTIQLEEAQQLAHIGSWEWDVVANKIEWSDELFRIFGLTPQEFKADYQDYLNYIHPDDREYVNAVVQQSFKDHQPYRFFHKTASADGNVRILSATGKVFTDEVGNVIKMSGTAQDVTEQKKYEEELKISEERFFKIFDSNPVPMSLTEIKTDKIKYANNLFYNAFGYTKEEVIDSTSEKLNLLDPKEYKRVIDLIFGYLQENRSLAEVQALSKEETENLLLRLKQSEEMKDFEILYTRKNGETFPAIVSFELIRIGTESYTVTSYQDITERKKSETLLKNQNSQLEKMNKELESFAYISSHDLQEPLRKIQTFGSRILAEEKNLSESGKDMFNRMQNSAKRMQTLIQDLLVYSRTGTQEGKFKTTDLNKIIAEVKDDLKEELLEKHTIIESNHLGDADIIPFQFRQLMYNLISNSLKFSNPHLAPHIEIKSEIATGAELRNQKLSPQNRYCHITVRDNGIGFEQQYSEKIFEVFQRLHRRDEYNGTGIGLSIVKKIVENHHGTITATGELNKGATFDIYIPSR